MKRTTLLLSLLLLTGVLSQATLAIEYKDPFVPDYIKAADSADTKDSSENSDKVEIKVGEKTEDKSDEKKSEEKKDQKEEKKSDEKKDEEKKDEKKSEEKKETKKEDVEYTVVGGDCLSAIAGKFLGDLNRWPELVEANKDKYPSLESNPNLIYIGWQLKIPGADSTAISNANKSSGSGSNSSSGGNSKAPTVGTAKDSSGWGSVNPCQTMPTWVSSEYGYRTHPVTGAKGTFHNGIDLPVPTGTRLNALANGVVTSVGYENGGGNYCTIRYDNGMESFYCHLQSSSVKVGQRVECGQQVALSDNTGAYTTGAHLHMGIKKNGSYVNPRDYLKLP